MFFPLFLLVSNNNSIHCVEICSFGVKQYQQKILGNTGGYVFLCHLTSCMVKTLCVMDKYTTI